MGKLLDSATAVLRDTMQRTDIIGTGKAYVGLCVGFATGNGKPLLLVAADIETLRDAWHRLSPREMDENKVYSVAVFKRPKDDS